MSRRTPTQPHKYIDAAPEMVFSLRALQIRTFVVTGATAGAAPKAKHGSAFEQPELAGGVTIT